MRFSASITACLAACGALVAPAAVRADDLTINAIGAVPQACSIAVASPFGTAALGTAGMASATATVNCNTGFVLKVTSANGALRTSAAATTGFANALPYSLFVSLPLDNASTISATCAATALVAGQASCALSPAGSGLTSGGLSAIGKTAQLQAQWAAPTSSLVAGSYSDTITVSIAASS